MAFYSIHYPTHMAEPVHKAFATLLRNFHCTIFGGLEQDVTIFDLDDATKCPDGDDIHINGVLAQDFTPDDRMDLLKGVLLSGARSCYFDFTGRRTLNASITLRTDVDAQRRAHMLARRRSKL